MQLDWGLTAYHTSIAYYLDRCVCSTFQHGLGVGSMISGWFYDASEHRLDMSPVSSDLPSA